MWILLLERSLGDEFCFLSLEKESKKFELELYGFIYKAVFQDGVKEFQ